MLKIHKYRLEITDHQKIFMPKKAQLLSVGVQQGECVYLWALVDMSIDHVEREIWIATTGAPYSVPASLKFVGTFMLYDGDFVGHVFG
jgi:hypothetical protein